jgi:hypothetical protein
MSFIRKSLLAAVVLAVVPFGTGVAYSQVSPAEISKPKLKHAEQKYFQQIMDLSRAISRTRFPFPVALSRYPGLDPKRQARSDERGIEFIDFQGRTVLKISANYNAAFNAHMLTQNQRANRVLDEVIIPVLRLLPKSFPPQSNFDGVGFEIAYHVRTDTTSYAYEGIEVLTIVFSKDDTFKFSGASELSEQQEILNNSQVFMNGKNFGLMLGQRDALPMGDSEESKPENAQPAAAPVRAASKVDLPPRPGQELPSNLRVPKPPEQASSPQPDTRSVLMGKAPAPATQADADALQTKLQAKLDALNTEGRAHDNFVDYAPPSFAVFRNQIYLQLTLRNPTVFDPNATSIYKRAARSFDLFLGPRIKSLLVKTPDDPAIAGLDITVLTKFSSQTSTSSEAIEFICPMSPLRSFANADITNQDLISQSVVLVNGVRIALDLQKVE